MALHHATSSDGEMEEQENVRQFRPVQTKYLDDVLEHVEADYTEIVQLIAEKQEEAAARAKENDFQQHINALITASKEEEDFSEQLMSLNDLLSASSTLLKIYKKASVAIEDVASGRERSVTRQQYEVARAEDQERVRKVLLAGKRVCEGEIAGREKRAELQEEKAAKGDEGAERQAVEVFGGGAVKRKEVGDAERVLKYLDKGVRKMFKGVQSG